MLIRHLATVSLAFAIFGCEGSKSDGRKHDERDVTGGTMLAVERAHKYTVRPRNQLKYNADGSLDLYVQHESPGDDKEPNWLPAPKDQFMLMLRLYWPDESVIGGQWKPPPVKRL